MLLSYVEECFINFVSHSISEFPEKLHHTEDDLVPVQHHTVVANEVVTRKVASAPTAPSYKGIIEPEDQGSFH